MTCGETASDFIYSILLPPGQTVIGEIGLHRRVGEGGMEIGYWVDTRYAGRGLGTEAARMLTEVALALPGVAPAEIHCDEANLASAAIPRKLGYRLDRIDPHQPEAPGEQGRRMVWVDGAPVSPGRDRASRDSGGQDSGGRDSGGRDWAAWHDAIRRPGQPAGPAASGRAVLDRRGAR